MSPRHTPSPRAERAVPPSPPTPAPPKSAPPPPLTSAPSTPPSPSPSKRRWRRSSPRSNQDQVLSPGSDKDIRNSLGSNQDQVINPWITRDLSTALAIARVLQHAFWKQGSITHPCRNKDSNNQALR
ncbi:hypothetical protein ACLKA6_007287 [Drosophila palustris]